MSAPDLDNTAIASRLEAFAALLELARANPYSARAYRRAAELIRSTPAPVAPLVRAGRVRELRGIGPGIEARLRELVATGRIAELDELERDVSPELVGVGRLLGISPQRALELGRALGVRTIEELREAARAGRLREVPGVGPVTEEKLRAALEREPRPRARQPLLLSRALELAGAIAAGVGGEVAGAVRRHCDAIEELAVVAAAGEPESVLARFEALPEIVAVVERAERRALGVTVEGVPVELAAPPPADAGTALVRATGSAAYVEALEPLPSRPDEPAVYQALGIPWCPPELREEPFRGEPPRLVEVSDLRGDLHCHTTWSDGRASVLEMGQAAKALGHEYLAICDHTPSVRIVPGLDADAIRRQGEEIAAANAVLAPFRLLRGAECDIRSDGTLDLPDDVLAELDWVQASVHAGQRTPRRELTNRVLAALENPYVSCLSHPTGRLIGNRPPNALDLDAVFETAHERGIAVEVNGLAPRLDLSGEHVHEAIEAGVRITCSTDSHSARGLENVRLSVWTARRGWATPADVLNTRPLDELIRQRA